MNTVRTCLLTIQLHILFRFVGCYWFKYLYRPGDREDGRWDIGRTCSSSWVNNAPADKVQWSKGRLGPVIVFKLSFRLQFVAADIVGETSVIVFSQPAIIQTCNCVSVGRDMMACLGSRVPQKITETWSNMMCQTAAGKHFGRSYSYFHSIFTQIYSCARENHVSLFGQGVRPNRILFY